MELIGNSRAWEYIRKNISDCSAYLFTGPDGIGKRSMAIEAAALLMCTESYPCGKCRGCTRTKARNHPDVMFLENAEGRASIGIDDVRSGIAQVQSRPYEGRHRVWIIGEAERLTDEAQSALLKTLEEPPTYLLMILCAPSENALLPTVVSRCRLIRFQPADIAEIARWLENCGISSEKAAAAAGISGGAPGLALRLAQDEELWEMRCAVKEAAREIIRADLWQALQVASRFEDMFVHKNDPKLDYTRILDILRSLWRDALCCASGAESGLAANVDCQDAIEELASEGTEKIIRKMEFIENARENLSRSVQPRLWLENLCLGLAGFL